MANLKKWQKQQIAANNAIKHNLKVGTRYELSLMDFAPDGTGSIKETLNGRVLTFHPRKSAGVYVGDGLDNDGFLMVKFKMDRLPWMDKPNTTHISGYNFDSLEKINPVEIK